MSLTIPSRTRVPETSTPAAEPVDPAAPPAAAPASAPPARLNTDLRSFKDGYDTSLGQTTDWVNKFGDPALSAAMNQTADWIEQSLKGTSNSINEGANVADATGKGPWTDGSAPVLQQRGDTDCGETVAAMLKGARDGAASVQGEQGERVLNDFRRFAQGDGTTPAELGNMLGSAGLSVKQSSPDLDTQALTQALRQGDKAAVMLDSKISGHPDQTTGKAHWVLIDGMDAQGRYLVKDPANGSAYYAEPGELADAIQTSRDARQSGGMLIVGNPDTTVHDLNATDAATIGDAPGTGSNWRRSSREVGDW